MKNKKKDLLYILILLFIYAIIVLLLTRGNFLYGSTLDWQTQHWSFAEYFRNLFYETKDLFPDFAFNIGAGQNVYNLSYYGLLSPIVLLSYLFPFVSMATYIQVVSILGVGISIILFYKWIRSHGTSSNLTFFGSLLFMLAAPFILHSHRHIMFVSYMPFLLMALIGVDKYFEDNKKMGLVLAMFLIIMTSYYYSIPSLLVILVYGIYVFLKKYDKITFKLFMSEGIKFVSLMVVAVLMAGVLLLPTMQTILAGRSGTASDISLISTLVPGLNLNYLLYGSYSVGLTAIIVFAVCYGFLSKDKGNIFLSIVLSIVVVFPIFIYVLNGMLYINAKVLIPFLPIGCFLILELIKGIRDKKVNVLKLIGLVLIVSGVFYLTTDWSLINYYLVDALVVCGALILYYYKNFKYGLVVVVISAFVTCGLVNYNDSLMTKDQYDELFNDDMIKLFDETEDLDDNLYRSFLNKNKLVTANRVYGMNYYNTSIYSSGYNSGYKEFYKDTFANPISYRNYLMISGNRSILWNTYMGVRYFVTSSSAPLGYSKVDTIGDYSLYQNDLVYPIGYVNKNVMSVEKFEELDYPYSLEALMKYTIVDEDVVDDYESTLEPYDIDYSNIDTGDLSVTKKDDGTIVLKANDVVSLKVPIGKTLNDEILLIRFKMNYESTCSFGDTAITINGVKNTLTCRSWKYKNENYTFDYVISRDGWLSNLMVEINPGTYVISDIESYIYSYQELIDNRNSFDDFVIDKDKTKGDVIVGTVDTEGGYFSMSIPYDKGFKIYVDGDLVQYEVVDTTFIGFKLDEGVHEIKLTYEAPWKKTGLVVTIVGFVLWGIIGISDIRRKNERED